MKGVGERGEGTSPGRILAVGAIALAAVLAGAWWFMREGAGTETAAPPTATATPTGTGTSTPTATPTPTGVGALGAGSLRERPPASHLRSGGAAPGPPPSTAPPPNDRAEPSSGLAAFPPLGTKPLQRGLVVPDGFELPPGYVRHYQTTDDGEQLPPILKFHPDHQPLDAAGRPVTVPPDRVVPPELAPAGMPLERLEPPPQPAPDR